MMSKPLLVIVGRPNVGKSTLFNRIVGSMAAIVEDIPGVTRDANYMDAQWEGRGFTAVDTGGFYPEEGPEKEKIYGQMREQALFAIEEADLIIHLLDGKEGVNPVDRELAGLLRESGKKVIWAVNKIDAPSREERLYDFFGLGVEPIAVSAATGYNLDALMEKALDLMPPVPPEEPAEYPKVAVIGRTNVGKSTLINSLLGKRRMIVSPVPGTTRDSIDSVCIYYRKRYLIIDTAGIRRKRAGYDIEKFALVRTMRSIERADVCLVLLDARDGITSEDQKIAGMVQKNGKGAVFLFNKWDIVEDPDAAYKKLMEEFGRKLWFFSHAPVITTSGLERKRITKIFPVIDGVINERKKRISTSELNEMIRSFTLPPYKGRKVRLDYMTQVGVEPPRFALFTSLPEGVRDSQLRHIESLIRENFGFAGTPIRIFLKRKAG